MTSLRWLTLPFQYTTTADFFVQLNKWLSDVFYFTLPGAGFEIREEQVYTCYKIVSALREKEVLMAEAGSGTGKTFAYLLPALCYARLTGKPAVIACSSAALQEQLVWAEGDIAALSGLLQLDIKAVLAKNPENYVCSVQADLAKLNLPRHPVRRQLLQWLDETKTGERTELPGIDDELWAEVAFNPSLDCQHCRRRGYCHVAKARQNLWGEQDFIICSHAVFFKDLWTRRQRQQKERRFFGLEKTKVPYLPHYSALVLDEGHLIETPALFHLGVRLSPKTASRVATILTGYPLVTAKMALALENLEKVSESFFATVSDSATPLTPTQFQVKLTPTLTNLGSKLLQALAEAQEEMALYQQYDINQYISELDSLAEGLSNLLDGEDSVAWWEPTERSLPVLPRDFSQALGRELLGQNIPIIFTSATLDSGDDFRYFQRITGIEKAKISQVASSFALEEQMQVYLPADLPPGSKGKKVEGCAALLRENGGRALILCNDPSEVQLLHENLGGQDFPFNFFWEGSGDSSFLLQKFREDETSVLIGTKFWEGIDIPGPSLTMVIIFSLPFPPHSPLLLAKRESAAAQGLDPDRSIDLPAMLIKLRQGIGRLLRSKEDYGLAVVFDCTDRAIRRQVQSILPRGVRILETQQEIRSWQ